MADKSVSEISTHENDRKVDDVLLNLPSVIQHFNTRLLVYPLQLLMKHELETSRNLTTIGVVMVSE